MKMVASLPRLSQPSTSVILKVVSCIAACAIVFYIRTRLLFFPCTFYGLCQLGLADINRRKGLRRLNEAEQRYEATNGNDGCNSNNWFIASVVGYREEPVLWKRTLKSYLDSVNVETILLGIDGNGAEDLEMADAVIEVFGATTIVIPLPQAYGPIAERLAEQYLVEKRCLKRRRSRVPSNKEVNFEDFDIPASVREESFAHALKTVVQLAKMALLKHGFQAKHLNPNAAPQAICIHQPHHNKKEIMFSNFIFCLALSSLSPLLMAASGPQIQHIWTSDSDTLVHPTTVHRILACLDAEPLVGGATCGLSIHNSGDSVVSRLASAALWAMLSIKRGQPAVTDSVIIQPGACAAFRLAALEGVLMRWYTGRNFGVKMAINEDIYLTTLLLRDSWRVIFLPDLIAVTDVPSTLRRWLMQQIRWSRAARCQCTQSLLIYLWHGALPFTCALLGYYMPLENAALTVYFALTGNVVVVYQVYDVLLKMFLNASWLLAVQSREAEPETMFWLMLSQVFQLISRPGIEVYSSMTFWVGEWGTSMGRDVFRGIKLETSGPGKKSRIWSSDECGAFAVMAIWLSFVAVALARWIALQIL